LSNYAVHYKSQLPLYKEPHVSATDKFNPHLSTFLCFVARLLAAARIKQVQPREKMQMSDAIVQEMLRRVKTAITKLGFLHLLLETELVSEVLF
jgi:hypothetical protein